MNLESVTQINVDFYNNKYITINAKQHDKSSRLIKITCYDHGVLFPVNNEEHEAFIRYKKADGYSVLNMCPINNENNCVYVLLTEQMLSESGLCCADLILVKSGSAILDADTGEIVEISDSGILSTMPFYVNVFESAVENSEIESNYEFNGFNEALEEFAADYANVIKMAKSWSEGGTGIRENEDTNNAKYWSELAHAHVVGDLDDKIVTGIKIGNDDSYRTGFIDVTVENIGAVASSDVATVDEVKDFLSI